MQTYRLRRWLRSALWFVPVVCVVAAILLSLALQCVDRRHPGLVPTTITGSSTSVSTILSTVATSMVTLTALVLSIMTVAVQLSMSQFSPRIVPALLQDRPSQLAFGLFGATFTFAGMTIRVVDEPKGFVPGISVLAAYGLTLASIATLFLYMQHSAQRMRVGGLIDFVGDQLVAELACYPEVETSAPSHGSDGLVVAAEHGGVADVIHVEGLVAVAARWDCLIEIVPRLGDFVPTGAPIARVHAGAQDAPPAVIGQVRRHVLLTSSRTHTDDPAYGMRKLVDIAERSLSSGPFTDPTTAVQTIDRLHDALRQLARRRLPASEHRDAHGELRLVTRQLDWGGFVRLAFDEIRLAGAASPQVARRVRSALEDLLSVAPEDRHAPLQRQLDLLDAGVRRAYDDDEDVAAHSLPDAQGLGSGRDVVEPSRA